MRLFHDDKPSANSPSPTSCAPTRLNRKTSSPTSAKPRKVKPRWRTPIPLCAKCGAATGCLPTTGIWSIFPRTGEFFHPVGTTDSERAFCHILNRLRTRFAARPDDDTLFDAIAGLTHEIRKFGLFNFMLSDGISLFAHASTLLHYIVRQAPFGKARLLDDDVMVDFAEVTTPDDRVAVISTLPLTRDESWSPACRERTGHVPRRQHRPARPS